MAIPIVTVATIISKGYPLSTLKSEGLVTLADADIKDAYFPSTELFTDEKVITLLHALVYSLLLRRKIVSTRYGSVTKVSQYTIAADNDSITAEIRSYCLTRLESYLSILFPLTYSGLLDASTGSILVDGIVTVLVNGTGITNSYYKANVAGTYSYGSGDIILALDDYLYYNGLVWLKIIGGRPNFQFNDILKLYDNIVFV